tara:strand:+ start:982 stop:1719 length:738 start_codon:yes stop_codon:yes gene_type:complete
MKILVIGDGCYDIFKYGDVNRMCPEAPVPVFNPTSETKNGGMALNVVSNLESLGVGDVDYITNETEIRKIRYVDSKSNQMVIRVDENDFCERCNLNGIDLKKYDAIIISDYCKGFLEEEDIFNICKENENVFIDTKKKLDTWITNAKFIKLNQYEYKNNKDFIIKNDWIFYDKLIVTYGAKGCYYQKELFPPKDVVEIKDVSGAGDTFISALVVEYLKSTDLKKSIEFAQKCASIVVSKKGVVTI